MKDIFESTIIFFQNESLWMVTACAFTGFINLLFSYFRKTKLSELVNVIIRQKDKQIDFEANKDDLDNIEIIQKINNSIEELKNTTGSTENIEIFFKQSKKKNSI